MSKPQGEIAVKVEHLTKSFKIPLESSNGLKQKLINTIKGRKGYRTFTPLSDISFEIKKGEFFGIVGRNGSGKSTLLKSIAGIYTIESGKVSVDGTLVPFIELGVGFNAELSGRENVYLNGALLGFSNKEMAEMYDEIVDFAELHDFMEERLKNYSSGMQVRLAFSIAIRAKGDILLLDEVLAVGDEAFQRKCYSYFADLKKQKKTVILVTHAMSSVEQFCDRAILIDNGAIKLDGQVKDVSSLYRQMNMPKQKKQLINNPKESTKDDNSESLEYSDDVKLSLLVQTEEAIRLSFDIESKISLVDISVAIVLNNQSGRMVYRWVLDENVIQKKSINAGGKMSFSLEIQNIFPDGEYTIRAAVRKRDKSIDYIVNDNIASISLSSDSNSAFLWKPKEKLIMGTDESLTKESKI